jgi:hypothetical protein
MRPCRSADSVQAGRVPADDGDVDDALIVRRWRRLGADRLYVTAESGRRVGVIDLRSGEVSVDLPVLEEGVRRAAQAYLRSDVTEVVLPFGATDDLASFDRVDDAAADVEVGPHPGERGGSVRSRLERLTQEGWQVVHAVPLGRQGTVLQHLLIGPGGLFSVTSYVHPGERIRVEDRTIEVDGRPVPYLRDARLEAARVQGVLRSAVGSELSVRAVLVLQGTLDMRSGTQPENVLVVERHDVPRVFRRFPERLEPARVDAIAVIARQRGTWAR